MTIRILAAAGAALVLLSATAEAAEPTLDKIRKAGAVVLGVRDASYPLSYLGPDQAFIGYHVDICHRIVDAVRARLGQPDLKVEYRSVTSQSRIPMMVEGAIDLECGSTTNTETRQEKVAFAPTTYLATVRIGVKKRSGVKELQDLDGRVVVTTSGSTGLDLLRGHPSGRKLAIKTAFAKDHRDSFRMLETDEAAAFVMDDNLLAGLIMTSSRPDDYILIGQALDLQPIAIMLRKNDPAFKKLVDETVAGLMKSGEIRTLYAKWFEAPIPPANVPMNMPMTEMTRILLTYPDSQPAEAYRPTE